MYVSEARGHSIPMVVQLLVSMTRGVFARRMLSIMARITPIEDALNMLIVNRLVEHFALF